MVVRRRLMGGALYAPYSRPFQLAYGRRRRRRHQRGGFGWSDVWNGVKKAHQWVKDNKIVTKVLKQLPGVPKEYKDLAQTAGYGRRRRRVRRRMGRGVTNLLF